MSVSKTMPYWGSWQVSNLFLSIASRGICRWNSTHTEQAKGITASQWAREHRPALSSFYGAASFFQVCNRPAPSDPEFPRSPFSKLPGIRFAWPASFPIFVQLFMQPALTNAKTPYFFGFHYLRLRRV